MCLLFSVSSSYLITISEYPARHLLIQTNLRYNYLLDYITQYLNMIYNYVTGFVLELLDKVISNSPNFK